MARLDWKWIALYVASAIGILLLATCSSRAGNIKRLNVTVDQTNFVVNSGCSGTLIDLPNRYILTADHCVDAQYETVEREEIADDGTVTKKKVRRLRDGTVTQLSFSGTTSVRSVTYKTRLVAVEREKDLAVVQILAGIPNTQAAPIACSPPSRGDQIYIVGNPMGSLYSSMTTGIVSSLQRDYAFIGIDDGNNSKQPLMQVSGGVVGGNSGGAVYNMNGELVGVPVLAHRVNEMLAFAVPLDSIKEFLRANKLESVFARCEVQP